MRDHLGAIRAEGAVDYAAATDLFLLQAEAPLMANYNTYASLTDPSAIGAALAATDENNDRHDAESRR
jgi:hypothetical protein